MPNLFRYFLIIIMLSMLSAVKYDRKYEMENNVIVLNEKNFDEAVEQYDFLTILLYDSDDKGTDKLIEQFSEAATKQKEKVTRSRFAKIDINQVPAIKEKLIIKKAPEVKLIYKSNLDHPVHYGGELKGEQIDQWMDSRLLMSSKIIDGETGFRGLIQTKQITMMFWGDESHPDFPVWDIISQSFENLMFYHCPNPDKVKKLKKIKDTDVITMMKLHTDKLSGYSGEITFDNVKKFINDYKFPIVVDYNKINAEKIWQDQRPAFYLVIKDDDPNSQKALELYTKLAEQRRGDSVFTLSNVDDGLQTVKQLQLILGYDEKELPAVYVYTRIYSITRKYRLTKEITLDNLLEFHDGIKNDLYKPYLATEPLPPQEKRAIQIIVGQSFNDIVYNNQTDVIVQYYVQGNEQCSKFSPEFFKVSKNLKGMEGLVFAKMDAAKNLLEDFSYNGFPTVLLYPKNDKTHPIQYNVTSNYTGGFQQWVKDNVNLIKKYDDNVDL